MRSRRFLPGRRRFVLFLSALAGTLLTSGIFARRGADGVTGGREAMFYRRLGGKKR